MVESESAIIELKDVEMQYDNGTQAIRGISLRINPGEFVFHLCAILYPINARSCL